MQKMSELKVGNSTELNFMERHDFVSAEKD